MKQSDMSPREAALYDVQKHAFAVKELQLFLDTHPDECDACVELRRQNRLEQEALGRYEDEYGPLTISAAADGGTYRWTDDPWPWEGVS